MKLLIRAFSSALLLLLVFQVQAQTGNSGQADAKLPKVFLIGEHEQAFEKLTTGYEADLLKVCDNDMQNAFDKWIGMMEEMEAYAKLIEYDLDGVKAWFHVFWDTDGTIEHIAYYLRPNSRNVDLAEMNAFLSSFMNNYKFPMTTETKFHHYTGAAFPVYYKKVGKTD